jgi:hypothetical protein
MWVPYFLMLALTSASDWSIQAIRCASFMSASRCRVPADGR